MRTEPTPAEFASIAALIAQLKHEGSDVEKRSRSVEDRPDAVLRVDDLIIACECVQVPPSYIYAEQHRKPPMRTAGVEITSHLWPNEPHNWVAEAVESKSARRSAYRDGCGAEQVWLLVHSPANATQFLVKAQRPWIQVALKAGASAAMSSFERVYMWTPQDGIQLIGGERFEEDIELRLDMSGGYPTLCVNRFTVAFRTPAEGAEPTRVKYSARNPEVRIIPPRDPEYAKHMPASRQAAYDVNVTAWPDRAEVVTTVRFEDEPDEIVLEPQSIRNLVADTDYWIHNLHEFSAPRSISILPRESAA